MSARKISPRRLSDFKKPRRAKPPINRQKRELKEALERETQLISTLMRDAQIRRAFERGNGMPREPMSVWGDSDQSIEHTELAPKDLPHWDTLTERMKMFLAFDAAMELRACYTFTAHIDDGIIQRWLKGSRGLMVNADQRLKRQLIKQNISGLAFCYMMETRTKSGRSATRPHLHGFLVAETPVCAPLFKVALEQAFHPAMTRSGKKRRSIMVKPGYDYVEEFIGRERWVFYITKNIDRWDARLGKRRVFISHSMTDLARLAWSARRHG